MLKSVKHSGYAIADVKAAARNNWFHVFETLAPGVFTAAIKAGHRSHTACPFHQKSAKTQKEGDFRFFKDGNEKGAAVCSCHKWSNGLDLLMDINRWDLATAIHEVGTALQVSPEAPQPQRVKPTGVALGQKPQWLIHVEEKLEARRKREAANQKAIRSKLLRTWKTTFSLTDPEAEPARLYLNHRGIHVLPPLEDVRFHGALPYYDEDGNRLGLFPALIGRVLSPTGEFVTLHRHYLTPEGQKAGVPTQKKMAPVHDDYPATGGAIRIMMPKKGVIGVAEGIETALSAFYGLGIPTWATVSASLLKGFVPPQDMNIHTVCIFADKDKSEAGKEASLALKEKLLTAGYEVLIMAPAMPIPENAKGVDWNDVLLTQGTAGFPSVKSVLAHLPRHSQILMNMKRGVAC